MEYINNTKVYKNLVSRDTQRTHMYTEKLELLEKYLIEEYQKLITSFESYTKHDWTHTINVLNYMYDLLDDPSKFTEEDLMLMIFTALLHDIGMAWSTNEVKILLPNVNQDEKITEIIRVKHGEFAEIKINKMVEINDLQGVFKVCSGNSEIDNWNLVKIVGEICKTHTKSVEYLQTVLGDNAQAMFVACLLRLGDLLDIDAVRATPFYQASHHINEDSKIHFLFNEVVGDSEKVKSCIYGLKKPDCFQDKNLSCEKCCKRIELTITYPVELDYKVEARICNMLDDYINDLKSEIEAVKKILNNTNNQYNIRLLSEITCKSNRTHSALHPQIDAQKISIDYSAMKIILFEQEVYPNKLYGIREIVQNAYDACKEFIILKEGNRNWEPRIVIRYDSNDNTLSICDNGVGMTEFVVREYFLNIGKSVYNFDPKYLYDDYHKDHIGHFGLGFFAAFMLSSEIKVKTQSYLSDKSIEIEVDKNSNFATLTYSCPPIEHGTEVILNFEEIQKVLKIDDKEDCLSVLCQYITDTFLFDGINIIYKNDRNSEELSLKRISEPDWDDISKYLDKTDAYINVIYKKFPPIFYAKSSDECISMSYEELLKQLAIDNDDLKKIPLLDAGLFYIFPGDASIEEDFMTHALSLNPRKNYSPYTHLSDSLPINIDDFCKTHKINSRPTHSDYRVLDLIVKGNSSALCERNVICARYRNAMRMNDACGDAQLDDEIYLRDVLLPLMHISLPVTNFRYDFVGALINIKTDNIFPTLARDTLTNEKVKEISYALGYAILKSKEDKGMEIGENSLIVKELYKQNNLFFRKEKV